MVYFIRHESVIVGFLTGRVFGKKYEIKTKGGSYHYTDNYKPYESRA